MSVLYRRGLASLAIFFLSLVFFTWGLSAQEIIGFESRFYLFALEMWRYGPTWFPTTYQQPYPDYPVTSTFLIYLFACLFGDMNKLVAVLPSALAASLTLVMTFCTGTLHSIRWGWYAVFFLLLTLAFLKSARTIALDMYPALVTVCCFYLVYSADKANKPARAKWIYPLLVLGFLFRGPIGLVMPTGVICVYYLLKLNFKKCFVSGLIALVLLLICTGTLLALAYHVGGEAFLRDVLRMQVLGRIDNSYLPVYFYFVDGMGNYALSFPLAALVTGGMVYIFLYRRRSLPDAGFLLKLVGWMLVILIGMSIPGDKKTRYILPMAPAIALIAAYPFAVLTREKYFSLLRSIILRIFLYFPALLMLATEAVFFYANNRHLDFGIAYLPVVTLLIAMQLLNFLVVFRYINREACLTTWMIMTAALGFVMTYIGVMEKIELSLNQSRHFVAAVEEQRIQNRSRLVFYKEKPDGWPIKYLTQMPHALPRGEQPVFIDDPQSLLEFTSPAFFVTRVAYFNALPTEIVSRFEIVAHDSMGHVQVVVFRRK
ncbi:hypothetical protein AQULUS_17130 [Aquicella lusitana]|uniref:4-amino-4-deoxy-L-arabinose transferase-like glycosyltransferase n=1 Tax=Aquicella lusitana TaxID=254246 RepID=A0A370GYJ2_9COXI|nr:4-amino-4-deoxy-L-arabinose transferase-like glycosyltransferase [Aquicella lusitana]VVC73952.1 hypothetical protein AQULUS_17130 [Aquicella lusitana]